jgi:CBS domain-containing protein
MSDPNQPIEKLVHRGAVSVHPEDTVQTVADTFTREDIGAALVRDTGGRVVGIISERDLVHAMADPEIEFETGRASDLMTFELSSVAPSDPIEKVARTMVDGGVRHLPVEDDDGPVGVVSIKDVLGVYVSG